MSNAIASCILLRLPLILLRCVQSRRRGSRPESCCDVEMGSGREALHFLEALELGEKQRRCRCGAKLGRPKCVSLVDAYRPWSAPRQEGSELILRFLQETPQLWAALLRPLKEALKHLVRKRGLSTTPGSRIRRSSTRSERALRLTPSAMEEVYLVYSRMWIPIGVRRVEVHPETENRVKTASIAGAVRIRGDGGRFEDYLPLQPCDRPLLWQAGVSFPFAIEIEVAHLSDSLSREWPRGDHSRGLAR